MYESNKIIGGKKRDYIFKFIPLKYVNKYESINIPSVNIYLFDALSRFRYFNQMKETNKFLKMINRKNHIFSFELYHTIGYNSKPNIIPLVYGCYKHENPKDFIYSVFSRNNFTIISNLAECDKYLCFYNLNKKNNINITHNLQIGCKEIANTPRFTRNARCVGNKQYHKWQLDYLEEALLFYRKLNRKSFSFTSFIEAHEPSFISITRVDTDFSNHLKRLYCIFLYNNHNIDSNFMESSINIILSDHGMHYGKYYNSEV